MHFSVTKIVFVILVIVFSVTIGNISNIIKINHSQWISSTNINDGTDSEKVPKNWTDMVADTTDDLLWFLQVSDLHISIFRDKDRLLDFEGFCDQTIDVIKPSVVLASGDLTDAKTRDGMGSRQFEQEWKYYRGALDKFNVQKKTTWLDVRGNHDIFNVMGSNDVQNYFRYYSVQGKNNSRSYLHTVKLASGKVVSFIALDTCLEPGPKRPFNFFGLVNQKDNDHLKSLIRKSQEVNSSHSIWFGHYPTSCILSSSQKRVRELIASDATSQAYLCGHLHTMLGIVPEMYTLQQDGFLELELADWKDSRKYRLGAIDHGLFSFTDVLHKEWPVVLVTNPKHALYTVPGREPTHLMATSTHIRILAFSTSDIISVRVKVDNEDWQPCTSVNGPLFVKSWKPQQYNRGIHHIQVEVVDKMGRLKVINQPFSLDKTTLNYNILPRLLLMTSASIIFQVSFGMAIVGCVSPLCLMRLCMTRIKSRRKTISFKQLGYLRHWCRRLWILANLNRFYYPLILYPLYLTVGPWAIAEIVDNHVGLIFAWGLFLDGSFLPGSFTHAFGTFQMMTFQVPVTLVIAYKLDKRLQGGDEEPGGKLLPLLYHLWKDLTLYLILFFQLLMLYYFWLEYGWLAVLLGPFRLWPVFATVYLWRQIRHTPIHLLQELSNVFEDKTARSTKQNSSHEL